MAILSLHEGHSIVDIRQVFYEDDTQYYVSSLAIEPEQAAKAVQCASSGTSRIKMRISHKKYNPALRSLVRV